jgi:hypothetical protein
MLANRLDITRGRSVVTKGMAYILDLLRQGAVGNKGLLPDLLEQLFFFDYTPTMLNQIDQYLKGARFNRAGLPILSHTKIVTVDTDITEDIGSWKIVYDFHIRNHHFLKFSSLQPIRAGLYCYPGSLVKSPDQIARDDYSAELEEWPSP